MTPSFDRLTRQLPLLGLALYLTYHVGVGLGAPPNGFHKWREADTATVAENFARQDGNFLRPRVNHLNPDPDRPVTDVVGMELPVYNYAVSLLYRAFGMSHAWPRALSALGGLALALGVAALARRCGGDRGTVGLAAYFAAFSPLVAFYSHKIQPDVWALALTVLGVDAFLRWIDGGRRRDGVLTALLLALAGGMKPTFFFVGLPMLWMLVRRKGWQGLRRPGPWCIALGALAPAFLWLSYARRLTEVYGWGYFYLGGDMLAEMASLFEAQFYQNVLLTWPFELAVGVPALVFVGVSLSRERRRESSQLAYIWLIGAYVVFILAAGHCASPHDYYYLPAVPAFVLLAAFGARRSLESSRRWLRRGALALILLLPLATLARIDGRFGPSVDFATLRTQIASNIAPSALALALDPTPGILLYETGLKGWVRAPGATAEDVKAAVRRGATVLVADTAKSPLLPEVQALLGAPVVTVGGLQIFPIAELR